MIDPIWEKLHREKRWGIWPETSIVRQACRKFPLGGMGGHAIDLGSGAGAHSRLLESMGFRVTALEGAQSAIDGASFGRPILHDVSTPWPVPDNTADLVIDACTTCHLSQLDAFFAVNEAFRVLEPGGWLIALCFASNCHRIEGRGTVQYLSKIDALCFYDLGGPLGIEAEEWTDGGNLFSRWTICAQKPL